MKISPLNNNFSLQKLPEFDGHKAVLTIHDAKVDLRGYIALHRGGLKNPTFGATRLWEYENEGEALREALKLSRIMTYKSALAGCQYGGAKAVLIRPKNLVDKDGLLKIYANYVNYLNGHFITGADVGIDEGDVKLMATQSNQFVGIKSDPVKFTVYGVFLAIQVILKELFGTETLKGRSIAIQGLGKTGYGLLEMIYKDAAVIYVTDIDKAKIQRATSLSSNIFPVAFANIYTQKVDIFSPCALSNSINLKTITDMKCKAIVGSANSQLENKQIGDLLHKMGILYAPDYVVNAGGLITVVDEYESKGYHPAKVEKRIKKIKNTLKTIVNLSKKLHKPTYKVADEMAEKLFHLFV